MALEDNAKKLLEMLNLNVGDNNEITVKGIDTEHFTNANIDLNDIKNVFKNYDDGIIKVILDSITAALKTKLTEADEKLHKAINAILVAEHYKETTPEPSGPAPQSGGYWNRRSRKYLQLGGQDATVDQARAALVSLVLQFAILQIRIILTNVEWEKIPEAETLLLNLAVALNAKVQALNNIHLSRLKELNGKAGITVMPQAGGSSDMYRLKYLKYKAKYMGLRSRRRY